MTPTTPEAAAHAAILGSYYGGLAVPRDEDEPATARAMVADNLAALRLIVDEALRQEALNAMGWLADNQTHYRTALEADDPAMAAAAAAAFDRMDADDPEIGGGTA